MAAKKPATSKTARRSMPTGSGGQTVQLGSARLLIPLNGGRNAYVRSVDGKNPNLATSSDAFAARIGEIAAAGFGAQLREEFDALEAAHPGHGWAATKARMEESGALAA